MWGAASRFKGLAVGVRDDQKGSKVVQPSLFAISKGHQQVEQGVFGCGITLPHPLNIQGYPPLPW